MKKTITLAALAAISTSASAFDYKFNLEGRADFISSSVETTTQGGATTDADQNSFVSNLIRLNMMGNINDALSYRMRYRFNQEGVNTPRDTSSNSLDYLYVDHKNALFTTRFGKTNWAEAYGRESFISSTDLFVLTDAYRAYNANIGTYRFGVSGTFTALETHKLTLAISNPNTELTDTGAANGDTSNTSLAYAAHYSSVMLDKMFQPTLSYTMARQDGSATRRGDTYTMWAAGLRSEVANFIIDADYKQFEKAYDTTALTTQAGLNGKTSSIFANISYNMDMLSPFVQYAHDEFDSQATAPENYTKNTYVAGVMLKPYNDVNFRYHLAYSMGKQEFDAPAAATTSEVKDNRVIFGIKADI